MKKVATKQSKSRSQKSPVAESKPKPAWNSLQTDLNCYKLSKEEIIKKKQALLSKHSIFYNRGLKSSTPTNAHLKNELSANSNIARKTSKGLDLTPSSLDLLSDPEILNESTSEVIRTPQSSVANRFTQQSKRIAKVAREVDSDGDDECSVDVRRELFVDSHGKALGDDEDEVHHMRTPIQKYSKKVASRTTTSSSTKSKHSISPLEDEYAYEDNEMVEIFDQIQSLKSELLYFQGLSAGQTFLDMKELDFALDLTSTDSKNKLTMKKTMKFLVQLVCQTMSQLLKNEIDKVKQTQEMASMNQRMDSFISKLSKQFGGQVRSLWDESTPQEQATSGQPSTRSLYATESLLPSNGTLSAYESYLNNNTDTAMKKPVAMASSIDSDPLVESVSSFKGTSTSDWLLEYSNNKSHLTSFEVPPMRKMEYQMTTASRHIENSDVISTPIKKYTDNSVDEATTNNRYKKNVGIVVTPSSAYFSPKKLDMTPDVAQMINEEKQRIMKARNNTEGVRSSMEEYNQKIYDYIEREVLDGSSPYMTQSTESNIAHYDSYSDYIDRLVDRKSYHSSSVHGSLVINSEESFAEEPLRVPPTPIGL